MARRALSSLVCSLCCILHGVAAGSMPIPFDWDTLGSMRYTFCNAKSGVLDTAHASWVSKQPVFLQGVPTQFPAEDKIIAQAHSDALAPWR